MARCYRGIYGIHEEHEENLKNTNYISFFIFLRALRALRGFLTFNYFQNNPPLARAVEFRKEYALPRAKYKAAFLDQK